MLPLSCDNAPSRTPSPKCAPSFREPLPPKEAAEPLKALELQLLARCNNNIWAKCVLLYFGTVHAVSQNKLLVLSGKAGSDLKVGRVFAVRVVAAMQRVGRA